jgi:hypothetical protein
LRAPSAPPRPTSRQRARSLPLIEIGKAALQAQDLAGARKALEQAYRTAALPETLFLLGRLAEAEGHILAAQDLMRRFLSDPAHVPDEATLAEAQRMQVSLWHADIDIPAADFSDSCVDCSLEQLVMLALPPARMRPPRAP